MLIASFVIRKYAELRMCLTIFTAGFYVFASNEDMLSTWVFKIRRARKKYKKLGRMFVLDLCIILSLY